MNKESLGRLEKVSPRTYWEREDTEFTPWLAQEDNIALLGDTIGIELEVQEQEAAVGPFRADILCRNTANGSLVLIENQLERTDHTHLGQLFTYAAGLDIVTIVWIARHFREEHRAALDWLNRITNEDFHFFGLEIELWRIDESRLAPKFNLVVKPNDWSKIVKEAASLQRGKLTPIQELQIAYWSAFGEYLQEHDSRFKPPKPQPSNTIAYGMGRSWSGLVAFVNMRDGRVGISLIMNDADSKAYYHLLLQEKAEIETDLGFEVEWSEKPEGKESHITIRHHTDTTNRDNWPALHAWTLEKMDAFDRVFRPRIKTLDASEWETDREIV